MSEEIKLTEAELDDVVGGKSKKKKKAEKWKNHKCNQCQIIGKMNETLYKIDDYTFCTEMWHLYKNGSYLRKDEKFCKQYM